MEVDGWIQVSLGMCCMCGKSFQNSPKPVLIFPIYIIVRFTARVSRSFSSEPVNMIVSRNCPSAIEQRTDNHGQ